MRIFLAGATGAIGRRLVPLLLDAGYYVVGTTRSTTKEDALRSTGVEPVVVDVFDAPALSRAVSAARPDIVIHQLTDLPPGLDPSRMAEGTRRTDRIRKQGTENLVGAALASGAHRLVAQSIAWMYAPGPQPHSENDPLDIHAQSTRATVAGLVALERLTLSSRQSKASCFATDIFTVRAPEPTWPERRHHCMLMRPPRPPCSRLRTHALASTTSLSRASIFRQKRRKAGSASIRAFGRPPKLDTRSWQGRTQKGCAADREISRSFIAIPTSGPV
jgi:nucleoside-diphosphate-sugar epimerase